MLFDSWEGLARTALVGVSAYVALLLLLRVSGKRTLSKMNAFDFVVTIALGSTLATILLSPDTPLAEGVFALGLLIFLQFAITWLSVRSTTVSRLVKAEPRLLFHDGDFLRSAMKAERVNEEEILQAVRTAGTGGLANVQAIILETDGSLSTIEKSPANPSGLLRNVTGYPV